MLINIYNYILIIIMIILRQIMCTLMSAVFILVIQ